jgi:UDP-glucuronate 4-epimerase
MELLVTGGAGFIGSHLALELAKAGHRVHALDNFDPYYDPAFKRANAHLLVKAGIAFHKLDLAEDPIEGVLEGIDGVFHLAAQPGNNAETPYTSYLRNNMLATVALLEALKGRDIRLVHVSTSSVYGKFAESPEETLPAPISPYGVTKLGAEAAVAAAQRRGEVSATILRCFSVYGERERPDKLFPKLFSALKHDQCFPLFEGSLDHQRSFSYVGDIVRGLIQALERFDKAQGEVFNLGSDKVFTTGQAIALAEGLTQKALKIENLPPRPGDQVSTRAVIDKARARIGYEPVVSLEEGLARVWTWAQKAL